MGIIVTVKRKTEQLRKEMDKANLEIEKLEYIRKIYKHVEGIRMLGGEEVDDNRE